MGIGQANVSRAKRDKRRSHHHAKAPAVVECPNCHHVKLPHAACPNCGFYKGRQVVKPREG